MYAIAIICYFVRRFTCAYSCYRGGAPIISVRHGVFLITQTDDKSPFSVHFIGNQQKSLKFLFCPLFTVKLNEFNRSCSVGLKVYGTKW
jgi:hypothetical protein